MGTTEHQRGKKQHPPQGGDDARKQHAPSRHGHGGGQGEPEHKRGSHREEPAPERQPESETDWPEPVRSPGEEFSSDSDDDRD
jgi:hypothetical protein